MRRPSSRSSATSTRMRREELLGYRLEHGDRLEHESLLAHTLKNGGAHKDEWTFKNSDGATKFYDQMYATEKLLRVGVACARRARGACTCL